MNRQVDKILHECGRKSDGGYALFSAVMVLLVLVSLMMTVLYLTDLETDRIITQLEEVSQ